MRNIKAPGLAWKKLPLVTLIAAASGLTEAAMLEEIVVTARKAEESMQSTPVAVTALNEEMLLAAQVTEIADLQRTTPSLSIMSGGTGSSALIFLSIRGNAQVSPSGGTDPAVATYVDGVYLARPTGGNVDMFDVSQAEVLRGPQGTLFGRNTTGGALNIRTNDPTDEMEGYIKGELGNYAHKRVEAVVNLPITEELASRFAVRYNDRDGYGDYKGYSNTGYTWEGLNESAGEIEENTYARGKIKWEPTDLDLTATLGLDYSKYEDSGQRTELQAFNPGGANGFAGLIAGYVGFDANQFIQQQNFGDAYWNADNSTVNPNPVGDPTLMKPGSTNEGKGIYLDVSGALGDMDFKSVTAYREATSSGTVDLDGTPLTLLTFFSEWDQDQWSQEFQLSGNFNDDLDWITGLYYFTEDSGDYSVNRFGGHDAYLALNRRTGGLVPLGVPLATNLGPSLGGRLAALSSNDAIHENQSYGAFAQVNYSFTEKLRGTLGFRHTFDDRKTIIYSESPIVQPGVPVATCKFVTQDVPGVCQRTQDTDFEYPAWVVSMDYQATEDLFLYAKTSGASMAGGWNFRTEIAPAFDPESVKDVELGFKSDMFDGTVRLNGALFFMNATDQQRLINTAEGTTPVQFIRNAGKSKTQGAEFEFTWLPLDGLTITASTSILDVEYDKYESTEFVNGGLHVLDRSGENPVHAPELTYSLGATQLFNTEFGELSLHMDYFWTDDTWFQDSTVYPDGFGGLTAAQLAPIQASHREEQKHNFVPDYGLLNAQAMLRTNDGTWEFAVFGKNLTDEEYYTSVGNFWTAFGTANLYVGDPATYGASVRYNW